MIRLQIIIKNALGTKEIQGIVQTLYPGLLGFVLCLNNLKRLLRLFALNFIFGEVQQGGDGVGNIGRHAGVFVANRDFYGHVFGSFELNQLVVFLVQTGVSKGCVFGDFIMFHEAKASNHAVPNFIGIQNLNQLIALLFGPKFHYIGFVRWVIRKQGLGNGIHSGRIEDHLGLIKWRNKPGGGENNAQNRTA